MKTPKFSKNHICSSLIALVTGLTLGGGSVHAALYVDTFSSDTSANYTQEDIAGSGGSFNINTTAGTLEVNAPASNTSTVIYNTARLAVGEAFVMQVSSFTAGRDFGMFVSNEAIHPSGTGTVDGFRFTIDPTGGRAWNARRVVNGAATTYTPTSPPNSPPATSQTMSMYIFRDTETTLSYGYDIGGGLQMLTFSNASAYTYSSLGSGDLWVGVETFGRSGTSILTIDSLSVIPEPSHSALIGLAGLCLLLRRRR